MSINVLMYIYILLLTTNNYKLSTLDKANKTGSSWMKVLISVSALLLSKSWYFLYVFRYLEYRMHVINSLTDVPVDICAGNRLQVSAFFRGRKYESDHTLIVR